MSRRPLKLLWAGKVPDKFLKVISDSNWLSVYRKRSEGIWKPSKGSLSHSLNMNRILKLRLIRMLLSQGRIIYHSGLWRVLILRPGLIRSAGKTERGGL